MIHARNVLKKMSEMHITGSFILFLEIITKIVVSGHTEDFLTF